MGNRTLFFLLADNFDDEKRAEFPPKKEQIIMYINTKKLIVILDSSNKLDSTFLIGNRIHRQHYALIESKNSTKITEYNIHSITVNEIFTLKYCHIPI